MLPRPSGIVVLLTDFGSRDPYVGLMKGMVLRSCPKAQLVDLAHDVSPQDVALGAFFLRAAIGRFPPGTMFLAVVDPGVGTMRQAVCALVDDCYWLGPDNGILGEVCAPDRRAEVRAVDFGLLGLTAASRTFHGRDLFAPIAGQLVAGRLGFTSVGPRCSEIVRVPPLVAGGPRVVHVDAYGNLVTNVPATAIANVRAVRIGARSVPVRGTYADAPAGGLLALINSYDLLEIAENQGNAAATLGAGRGTAVTLET